MTKIVEKSSKRKRVSKKNKISWRKHVNISDVEEFLEDQRLEERLGPPLETLDDAQLFTIDTKPDNEGQIISIKERRKLKLSKLPKCFSILQPHTNVPDPISKRNRVRTKEERKNDILKKKDAQQRELGVLKYTELQAINDRKVNQLKQKLHPKRGDFVQDIWVEDKKLIERNEWFTSDTIKHNLVGTGKSRDVVKNSKRIKTSILPSVELPHPGVSYNPSYEDHQNLLKIVAEKENKWLKEERHLNRVTRDMFSKVTEQKRDANWLKEMSEGLKHKKEKQTKGEYKSINPPVQNKKKTLQQKRKQKEQRALAHQLRAVKLEKKKVSDLHTLKRLKHDIAKQDEKLEVLREKRKRVELIKKKEPKRLNALKFEESDFDFNLGRDITGNLRNLKKEGNLLTDRFKSLQKRNIIQPTAVKNKKRVKVKKYTKPGHKDDWIKTVARAKLN